MQAVILAGGLAKRMLPRTEHVPKALLEVAGRPFIDWQLERMAAGGVTEVVMCVAHLGEQIRAHLGDHAAGIRIAYAHDELLGTARPAGAGGDRPAGAELLGTGGALRSALPLLAPELVVTYGDSYLRFDYAELCRALRPDCDGVMAVYRNEGRYDPSNVITDGEWVLRYEKGAPGPFDHIDYGATALRRDVIAALPAGEKIGLDTIQRELAAKRRLRAQVVSERFFEIGSPAGLADLDRYLRGES